MTYLEHVVAIEEISRASGGRCPGVRRAFQPLHQPDLPECQRRAETALPPKLISGEHVGALYERGRVPDQMSSV